MLKDRYRRLSLLNKILSNENKHSALSSAYDEINQDRVDYTMTTRSQTRGELNSISTTSKITTIAFYLVLNKI